ncbi:hypothetical protein [Streptomyces hoynatensis]|uniref:Uncharacterized protein n=1 Tax=Streptomyces hoynatensis TaxID=1141874 RepID=A0A3A9YFX9_9ACTN|nr:hypothetical protein [Streptomyces hoynatensis]RKN35949.1 hypothetical protein D7294_30430 [Streptomyces hoynatensis]
MATGFFGIEDATDSRFRASVTEDGALKVTGSVTSGGTTTADQGAAGSDPWPVSVSGTATVSGTVGLSTGANTVKLDAAANTVKLSGATGTSGVASATTAAPAAAAVLAHIDTLEGPHIVRAYTFISGTTAAVDIDNIALYANGTEVTRVITPVVGTTGATGLGVLELQVFSVPTTGSVELRAAADATAGSSYSVTLVATPTLGL